MNILVNLTVGVPVPGLIGLVQSLTEKPSQEEHTTDSMAPRAVRMAS